ncbi:GNAT family N-acetyltransferase [Paucibacter soli]|uniref:GNAT family N-acetyltransferase n=1 Tax=Paucibacter soli TaxID=3133433 RepID=UPI0030ADE0E5
MSAFELLPAGAEDLPRIERLMQFYNYDLSEWCELEVGDGGLYNIRSKAAYWAQPGVRPYLLRVRGELAGFAVVDDEVLDPAAQFNMGYFFIARRYRGRGLGLPVVQELLRRHPGRWELYHYDSNVPAGRFWRKVLGQSACAGLELRSVLMDDMPAQLYRFSTA